MDVVGRTVQLTTCLTASGTGFAVPSQQLFSI